MDITTRPTWGAAPPRSTPTKVTWKAGGDLWVHYSDGAPPPDDPLLERRTVRAIQEFHQGPERGWNDIGYAYLVAPSGRVYEGRGHSVLAAHCPGHNDEPSVCLLWRSGTDLPPKAALDSVFALMRVVGASRLRAHREGTSTRCPGDALHGWVVANRYGPPRPVTPVAPWTARAGGRVVGRGSLSHPAFLKRIAGALQAAGHRAPWVAEVDGRVVARGRFWPLGAFKRAVSTHLLAGRTVVLNDTVTLKKEQ